MTLCYDYDFQKWTVVSLGLTAATLIVGLVLMQVGHGQIDKNSTSNSETEKPRTFATCYSESAVNLVLWGSGIIGPPSPTQIDLSDPEVVKYLTNLCNFYHEKTGEWIRLTFDEIPNFGSTERDLQLSQEFQSKFTIPESVIQAVQAVNNAKESETQLFNKNFSEAFNNSQSATVILNILIFLWREL